MRPPKLVMMLKPGTSPLDEEHDAPFRSLVMSPNHGTPAEGRALPPGAPRDWNAPEPTRTKPGAGSTRFRVAGVAA